MSKNFNKYFDIEGIKFVEDKVDKYLPNLFDQKLYEDNCEKIDNICNLIESLNSSEVSEYFMEYEELKYTETTHLCWLAYNIGYQAGLRRKVRRNRK